MSLGSTKSLEADKARKLAQGHLASVVSGGDPAKERGLKRGELTVTDLFDLFREHGCYILRGRRQGAPMKPLTKAYTLSRLRHHAVPTIGGKRVTEVTATDIRDMARKIESGKTAKDERVGPRKRIIVRGGPARRAKWCGMSQHSLPLRSKSNCGPTTPCDHAKVSKVDEARSRYLSLDEVSRLGVALRQLEDDGINPKALNISRLWALTGCRRNEIAALKWAEVDFEHACLRLADSKTGKSVRPLAAPALALLAAISKEGKSPFVFPATSGESHYQGTKRIWPKAIKLAKLPDVTPHTLRHTLGSSAVSVGETLVMTGAILGHTESRSTQIYAHAQADPVARAAARAVQPIAAALKGKPPAEVVKLKKRSS